MSERFYYPESFQKNEIVHLPDSEKHHLQKVLRIKPNEKVELVDGKGSLATAIVEKEGCRILDILRGLKEKEVLLGIPYMRPSKLEWVLEKTTEIGVTGLFLYRADKSTQKVFSDHQIQRFVNILISGLKQSKRLFLPSLEILTDFNELLSKDADIFFGDVRKTAPPLQLNCDKPLFISGPESGFSEKEISILDKKGTGVCLNQNILRAETAPIVASSLFLYNKLT